MSFKTTVSEHQTQSLQYMHQGSSVVPSWKSENYDDHHVFIGSLPFKISDLLYHYFECTCIISQTLFMRGLDTQVHKGMISQHTKESMRYKKGTVFYATNWWAFIRTTDKECGRTVDRETEVSYAQGDTQLLPHAGFCKYTINCRSQSKFKRSYRLSVTPVIITIDPRNNRFRLGQSSRCSVRSRYGNGNQSSERRWKNVIILLVLRAVNTSDIKTYGGRKLSLGFGRGASYSWDVVVAGESVPTIGIDFLWLPNSWK